MTTKESDKLLIEYELVRDIIDKADKYGLSSTHPLMQYLYSKNINTINLYSKNICYPDCIINMNNKFYDILEKDMLGNAKPVEPNTKLFRIYKNKTETGYIDVRAVTIKEALILSDFKTQFYIPIVGTTTYITNYDRTGIHNSPLSS